MSEKIEGVMYDFEELSEKDKALVRRVRKAEKLDEEELDKLPYEEFARYLFDPKRREGKPQIFEGVRILDIGTVYLGPFIATFLAELGAEVIHIEMPGRGDTVRGLGPPVSEGGFIRGKGEVLPPEGTGIIGMTPQRNKLQMSLDLHPGRGAKLFKKLVKISDVVVENYRTGTMDQWGIGYRQLRKINPQLIYLAANGFGQWGYREFLKASYDLLGQAMSGFIYVQGPPPPGPPYKAGIYQADMVGAVWGAFALASALYYREKTGKSQFIEISQVECLMRLIVGSTIWYSTTGNVIERYGNRDKSICPYTITKCRDGYVMIGATSDAVWYRICDAIGRPDMKTDPRFKTNSSRVIPENQDELYKVLDEWVLKHTKAEIEELALKYGFAAGPVMNTKDICERPHYLVRRAVEEIEDPYYGKMKVLGIAPHFSLTPGRIKWQCRPMGVDTRDICRRLLNMSEGEIEKLEKEHILGLPGGAEGPEKSK